MKLEHDNITYSPDTRTGWHVGVVVDFPLLESLYIQSGLYYTAKGCKDESEGVKETYKPSYLEIPILASYRYNFSDAAQLQVNFGPYFAYGLGGKVKFEYRGETKEYDFFGDEDDDSYGAKRFDFGLQVGVGLTIAKHYFVGGGYELMKDLNVRVATNKEGKPEKIVNYDELKPRMEKMADQFVEKVYQAVPQLSQMLPKEPLKQQLMEGVTEEKLLKGCQNATSVMALNGKTVMTGAQEEYVNEQEMKMKRMYFVNGKNIVTNSSLNMSNDELKALIIAQVEKAAPDQAEMVKQNIDTLMKSGMLKMDVKETATYDMQDDGWVKNVTVDMTMDTMGQTTKTHSVTTCK